MNCTKCGIKLAEGALFCHKCGTKADNMCPSCGKKLMEGALFCAFCGTKVQDSVFKEVYEKPGVKGNSLNSNEFSTEFSEEWLANNKSMYVSSFSHDFNRICYQGKIYFLSSTDHEIWNMYEDGSEMERISYRDNDDNNKFIGVNRRGMFTYDDENPYVYQYSFTGELLNSCKLQAKGQYIKDLFILDDSVYYITSDESDKPKQTLKAINIDGSNPLEIYKGNSHTNIDRVLAFDNSVLYHIEFRTNNDYADGWYKYDLKTKLAVNLNSTILPPDELLTHPKKFDYDSRSYVEDLDSVEIFSFDLVNNIMWTFLSVNEIKKMGIDKLKVRRIIFPRRIGIAPPILKKDESWLLPEYRGTYMFDGEKLYYKKSGNEMFSVKPDGTMSEDWNKTRHGRVETLQMSGNCLIGDIYAQYSDYCYPQTFEKPDSSEIYKCTWKTPFILDRDRFRKILNGLSKCYNESRMLEISPDITEEEISFYDKDGFFYARFNKINLVDNSPYFCIEDGILYNFNKTKLLRVCSISKGNDIENTIYRSEINIPDTVTEIYPKAFNNTSVKIITLPESIVKIGKLAFDGAVSIDKIIIPSSVKEIGDFVFESERIKELHCKTGSYAEKFIRENYEDINLICE